MESTSLPLPGSVAAPAGPALSPWSRLVAVFARPMHAWSGLETRGQWWFPLVISLVVMLAGTVLTYDRAVVPTQVAAIERRVESGQIPPEQLDRIEQQMAGPVARSFAFGAIPVVLPLTVLAMALIPWIAVGFMLGRPFRYRDAFVVAAWAGLVQIPAQVIAYSMAWMNQSMEHLHTGFGVLLPIQDPPGKLLTGLGVFLDYGIGPLQLWYVAVLALGAAALSGTAPRRALTAVGALWIVVILVIAGFTALFAPGA